MQLARVGLSMSHFINRYRLVEILVVAIMFTLVGLLVMAVRHVRNAAERTSDL